MHTCVQRWSRAYQEETQCNVRCSTWAAWSTWSKEHGTRNTNGVEEYSKSASTGYHISRGMAHESPEKKKSRVLSTTPRVVESVSAEHT